MRVSFKYHGHAVHMDLERDGVGSPWHTRDNEPLPGGTTLDAQSGKVKLAPNIVDDHTEVTAIASAGSRSSDTATIESDSDNGAQPQTPPEVSLIGDSTVDEGQSAGYTLRLSKPAEADITVKVSIQHGTTDDGNVKTETRTLTISKGQQGATFDVATLDNATFQPGRNYRVEITEAQGATPKADEKTVETTINDNDPPSVPQMAAGGEPGSIDITPVAGTKALVVEYTDEDENGGQQHTLKINRNDSGKWESADDLPESVNLDAVSGKLTLGAKAVADGSEVKAHNDSEFNEGKTGTIIAGNNDGTNPPPPVQPNHAGTVAITGDAKVGGELKATVSDEDGVPQDGIKYQWQRDGADIKDATGATYKLTADDAGHKITVKAEYQDNGKHAEAPTSTPTDVAPDTPNQAPTGSVTISGMAQAGQTLHAGNTLADEDGMGEVNYQWLRDGKEISGATGGQYTLTADDVGHSISVKASYTDGKAHAESKDSLSSLKPAAEGTAPTYEKDYGEPTVDWAGFKWVARGGGFKEGGPQANHQWSKDNAHLDGTNMELSITNADKHTPVASEIVSTRAMGYGTYEATFHADFSKFDKYSVFGFFTFDWSQDKVDDGYREIDAVEISRWGDSVLKGTTTYYPHTSEKGVHPQPDSVWPENWTHGTVKLEWTPQKISWTLRNADTGEEVTKDITSDIVKPANQQMHFNLWTYKPGKDTKTDGWQDSAATDPQKVTLESFSYTPLKDDGSNHSNTPEPPKANLEHDSPVLHHSGDDAAHHDGAHAAALHHSAPQALHEASTIVQYHGSDGHDVLASDGIDVATYSGLMNLDGAALLSHLGEHSAELLAANKNSVSHELHGGAGDDVLIAGHGAALLEGGTGADTFAYLLDSNDATSWNEPSHILDFNPQEGDRIVLAGGDHVKAEVSSDAGGQHLHVTDAAGHVRTIDIASGNGKTLTAEDILSHVDIQTPQPSYEPSAYSVPQTPHLPQDDHSHLI